MRPPSKPPFGSGVRGLTPPKASEKPLAIQALSLPRVPPPPKFFQEEPATLRGNETIAMYQSLLALFDSMSANERLEFIELASLFRGLSPENRAYVIEEVNRLVAPSPDSSKVTG